MLSGVHFNTGKRYNGNWKRNSGLLPRNGNTTAGNRVGTLKLLLKKRDLFFFAPLKDSFLVAFVFGEKGVKAVGESDVPASVGVALKGARKYAEGRGVRITVTSRKDVKTILTLASIKVEN